MKSTWFYVIRHQPNWTGRCIYDISVTTMRREIGSFLSNGAVVISEEESMEKASQKRRNLNEVSKVMDS